jgi:hypothetical protein
MVKHIVLFRLDTTKPECERARVAQEFKGRIEALPAVIPFLRKVEVGVNINEGETWDITLYSEFDSLEDVKAYAVHPAHVACAALLKEYKTDRACVDYEI